MKVAVVGGGFSGMLAAYLLEQKHAKVTLFERSDILGGHCHTLVKRGFRVELGTVFCLNDSITELFDELKLDYVTRHTHRNFLDERYAKVQLLPKGDVPLLIEEMGRLQKILSPHVDGISSHTYGYVPPELNVPLSEFLALHGIKAWGEVVKPHLSAFGFGNIDEVQAYYAFNVFDQKTIASFVRGEQLVFINEGMQELVRKLSEHISDIRYAEVVSIEPLINQVKVATRFGAELYDKVLIATVLPPSVMANTWGEDFLQCVQTNPYVTCAFEVENRNIVTTYYRANLGKQHRLQFFHPYKHLGRTIIVAYAYGALSPDLVASMTTELTDSGISVKHLIAARQWRIFPHIKAHHLSSSLYADLLKRQRSCSISFIGSLIAKPSMAHLYQSTKSLVYDMFEA